MSGLSAPVARTGLTPVVQSVCRAIASAGVATLAESNFAQIDGLTISGGGVVAFLHHSRLLMFAHDTYSGTNGLLMPFVASTMVTTQVRSRDVTAFAN